jgi:hypothetical protein
MGIGILLQGGMVVLQVSKVRLVLCVKTRYVKGAPRLKARHFLFHAGTGTKWRIDVWSKTSLPPCPLVGCLSLGTFKKQTLIHFACFATTTSPKQQ